MIGQTVGNMLQNGVSVTKGSPSNGEIILTGKGGKAVLPPELASDPKLQELAKQVPGNIAGLQDKYNKEQESYNQIDARYKQLVASGATEAQLAKAKGRLDAALSKLSTAGERFAAAQGKLNVLQDYLVGRTINVNRGSGTYQIRGPNPEARGLKAFLTRNEAGLDALAMSWAIVSATGRNIEYGGYGEITVRDYGDSYRI